MWNDLAHERVMGNARTRGGFLLEYPQHCSIAAGNRIFRPQERIE